MFHTDSALTIKGKISSVPYFVTFLGSHSSFYLLSENNESQNNAYFKCYRTLFR